MSVSTKDVTGMRVVVAPALAARRVATSTATPSDTPEAMRLI
jgi:hypothetical protein